MAHLHKHNLRLLKKYLRNIYTNDELIELSNRLPEGFGQFMCLSASIVHPVQESNIIEQSAADDYLDYLSEQW